MLRVFGVFEKNAKLCVRSTHCLERCHAHSPTFSFSRFRMHALTYACTLRLLLLCHFLFFRASLPVAAAHTPSSKRMRLSLRGEAAHRSKVPLLSDVSRFRFVCLEHHDSCLLFLLAHEILAANEPQAAHKNRACWRVCVLFVVPVVRYPFFWRSLTALALSDIIVVRAQCDRTEEPVDTVSIFCYISSSLPSCTVLLSRGHWASLSTPHNVNIRQQTHTSHTHFTYPLTHSLFTLLLAHSLALTRSLQTRASSWRCLTPNPTSSTLRQRCLRCTTWTRRSPATCCPTPPMFVPSPFWPCLLCMCCSLFSILGLSLFMYVQSEETAAFPAFFSHFLHNLDPQVASNLLSYTAHARTLNLSLVFTPFFSSFVSLLKQTKLALLFLNRFLGPFGCISFLFLCTMPILRLPAISCPAPHAFGYFEVLLNSCVVYFCFFRGSTADRRTFSSHLVSLFPACTVVRVRVLHVCFAF